MNDMLKFNSKLFSKVFFKALIVWDKPLTPFKPGWSNTFNWKGSYQNSGPLWDPLTHKATYKNRTSKSITNIANGNWQIFPVFGQCGPCAQTSMDAIWTGVAVTKGLRNVWFPYLSSSRYLDSLFCDFHFLSILWLFWKVGIAVIVLTSTNS